MTDDDFTTAMRAESEARFGFVSDMSAFEDGAEWARLYLAAQEPTDAAERQVKAVRGALAVGVPGYHASGVPLGLVCKVSDIRRALDGDAGR